MLEQRCGGEVIAYIVTEGGDAYLCVIDEAGGVLHKFGIGSATLARLAAEAAAEMLRRVQQS